MAKWLSARFIKSARIYTVEEAAYAMNRTPSTIRNWIAAGMTCLRGQRPILIRGQDLKAWLQSSQAKRRVLGPHEFLCFACKAVKTPYGGMVDLHDHTDLTPRLSALCPDCGGQIHRIVRRSDLLVLSRIYDVKSTGAQTP